jgi:hypothetical protein
MILILQAAKACAVHDARERGEVRLGARRASYLRGAPPYRNSRDQEAQAQALSIKWQFMKSLPTSSSGLTDGLFRAVT